MWCENSDIKKVNMDCIAQTRNSDFTKQVNLGMYMQRLGLNSFKYHFLREVFP